MLFTLVVLFYCVKASGQVKPRESLDPSVTEVWDLEPPKVSPGKSEGQPPSDAQVLFAGDLSQWTTLLGKVLAWEVKEGIMTVAKGAGSIKTKEVFGDVQLHVEWRTPLGASGGGQNQGNSGIFLQERYEVQVLDSYENKTYSNGQAGSIYKQAIPLVNASRKPGEWQVYDIIYTAPRFNESGRVITPAFITVVHNGVLIHNHFPIQGPTEYKGLPVYEPHGKASLMLQDHGEAVSYRNIWLRRL